MTETNTANKSKRAPSMVLTGTVIETSPVKTSEKCTYTVSKILDSNGKTKTMMCFNAAVETIGKTLEVGQTVRARGDYREGTEGGYLFVATSPFKGKAQAAA